MNSNAEHILVVDDEPFIRNAFKLYLETNGYRVSSCDCGEEALMKFRDRENPAHLVLLDLVMPGLHGLELLQEFKLEDPSVEVIIATGCGSMNSAIEALRLGAFDYITKPIVDFDRDLLTIVQKALQRRQERMPQVATVEGEAEQNSRDVLLICANLEALATGVANASSRAAALEKVECFFAEHFQTVGGLVSDHTASSMFFRYGWGPFSGCEDQDFSPPAKSVQIDFWFPLLRSTCSWENLNPQVSLPAAFFADDQQEESLEVLRVPLVPGKKTHLESTSLFVFRRAREGSTVSGIVYGALLALVVNAALAKGEVHVFS